jgi:hypothetical protein
MCTQQEMAHSPSDTLHLTFNNAVAGGNLVLDDMMSAGALVSFMLYVASLNGAFQVSQLKFPYPLQTHVYAPLNLDSGLDFTLRCILTMCHRLPRRWGMCFRRLRLRWGRRTR